MERIQKRIDEIDNKLDHYFSEGQKLSGLIIMALCTLFCLSLGEGTLLQNMFMFLNVSFLIGFVIDFRVTFKKFRYNSQNKKIAISLKDNFINETFK